VISNLFPRPLGKEGERTEGKKVIGRKGAKGEGEKKKGKGEWDGRQEGQNLAFTEEMLYSH